MNESPKLPIDHQSSDVPDVPTFGCVVYVRQKPGGGVEARVANLAGIQIEAATERDALTKILPQFKKIIQDHLQSQTPIPWIDPPGPLAEGEQKRFLPMHL